MLSDQALHENQLLFHSVAGLIYTPWFHGLKARHEDKSFWLFEKRTLSPEVLNISGILKFLKKLVEGKLISQSYANSIKSE